MRDSVFVGNEITMEGVYIEIPEELKIHKKAIENAIYNVFESNFCEKEQKDFLKTMKINGVLFDFIEYHVNSFLTNYKGKIDINYDKNNYCYVKDTSEKYFINSLNEYKNKILSVEF